MLSGNVTFAWSADFALHAEEGFEAVVWRPGDDPSRNAYGLEEARNVSSITVPLENIAVTIWGDLVNGQTYQWGVRIYNKRTNRAELVSEARTFTYTGN